MRRICAFVRAFFANLFGIIGYFIRDFIFLIN
jgi:hypothetical protein